MLASNGKKNTIDSFEIVDNWTFRPDRRVGMFQFRIYCGRSQYTLREFPDSIYIQDEIHIIRKERQWARDHVAEWVPAHEHFFSFYCVCVCGFPTFQGILFYFSIQKLWNKINRLGLICSIFWGERQTARHTFYPANFSFCYRQIDSRKDIEK